MLHITFIVFSNPSRLLINQSLLSPLLSSPPDYQNLSVDLAVRPTSAMGVMFALVHQDSVPFSVSFADYHPAMDEWRDVGPQSVLFTITG